MAKTSNQANRKKKKSKERILKNELENQFKSVISALRTTKSEQKPHVLLLGKSGAGKTSLLAKSGVSFQSPFKKSIQQIGETQSIDWWISDEVVFVDPSGRLCLSLDSEPEQHHYWQLFLKLAKEKWPPQPFTSIALVIDFPSLIHLGLEDLIHRYQEQIRLLATASEPLTINIVITQCDHLAGYAEFFSILDSEQQQQPFGFSLSSNDQSIHIRDNFLQKFKEFLTLINQRLLNRLHHEPNHERRLRIHDFPLQLERLEKPLDRIISSFPDAAPIFINHIFFCSTQQTTHTVNVLSDELNKAFQIKPYSSAPLVGEERPLFIEGMILHLASHPFSKNLRSKTKPVKKWRWLSYPIVIILLFGLTAFLHKDYQKNITSIQKIYTALPDPSARTANTLPWLSTLKYLKQVQVVFDKQEIHKDRFLGLNQTYQLKQKIGQQYNTILEQEFIPSLNAAVANIVKKESDENSPDLYTALQVYLMLADPQQRNSNLAQHWLHKIWGEHLNPYLTDSLQLDNFTWSQDVNLISQARETLQKQPLDQIAFKILYDNSNLKKQPILTGLTIEGIDLSQAQIADFYATNNFSIVYNKEIPELADKIFKGDWVLSKSNQMSENDLIAHLRSMYLQHYLKNWQKCLKNIRFLPADTFKKIEDQTNLLINPDSLLWQTSQKVISAATEAGAGSDLDAAIKQGSFALANYLPKSTQGDATIKALTGLHDYLKQMDLSPSAIKASYDSAAKHMSSQDAQDPLNQIFTLQQNLPTPLQNWVMAIQQNAWQLILNNAQIYLNTIWKTEVFPEYQKNIENRFPIYTDSDDDISIHDFNHFFGPGGIIQNYFNQDILPFVDMTHDYWTWKTVQGMQIPISQSFLDMLMRASMIQKMFYSNNHKNPMIGFTLTPINMGANIEKFSLNIGGQMVSYVNGVKSPRKVTWPGPDKETVTLHFINPKDKNPSQTAKGPWAWLRVLKTATIQEIDARPDLLQVTFKLSNSQATYQLIADNPVNPYLTNLITAYRCSESIPQPEVPKK